MSADEHVTGVLREHAEDCAECAAEPLPLPRIDGLLRAESVHVDAARLSEHVRPRLRAELAMRSPAAFGRRVIVRLLLALLPLPAILAYDAYILLVAYDLAIALLPLQLAAFVVCAYAAALLLLFASTYAVIPLLLARAPQPRPT
jgi:hypothetical protein